MLKILLFCCTTIFVGAHGAPQLTSNFTARIKQDVLDVHNDARSKCALGVLVVGGVKMGPAANMRKLIWLNSLAAKAQKSANNLTHTHTHTSTIGESIFHFNTTSRIADPQEISVKMVRDLLFAASPTRRELHQMLWAATRRIGCGVVARDDGDVVVVCRYDPPGNQKGEEVFVKGTKCDACPKNTGCEESTGLCVV